MHRSTHRFTLLDTGEVFEVELSIDIAEVARTLAARAKHSKSGNAQALGGLIKAKVIKGGKQNG